MGYLSPDVGKRVTVRPFSRTMRKGRRSMSGPPTGTLSRQPGRTFGYLRDVCIAKTKARKSVEEPPE